MIVVAVVLTALLGTGGAAPAAALPPPAQAAAPAPLWSWPVPAPHPVLRAYLAPPSRYGAGHRGIDVGGAPGAVVTAPDDGVVVFAGRIVDRGVLAIEHPGGVRSSFEPVTPTVRAGEVVHRGEAVAVVTPAGAHGAGVLHIGARLHGEYISPLLLLGGLRRAVLLSLEGQDLG